jgi:hypothetical protein
MDASSTSAHVAPDVVSGQKVWTTAQTLILAGSLMFATLCLWMAARTMFSAPWVIPMVQEHFPAIVGLPFAALAALCLVMLLELCSGPIRMKGLGFEFEGAGGPLVLWLFCFLAIASAIKLVW